MSSERGLWPHQSEAVEKICASLTTPGRATAVSACGTGKTIVGAESSRRIAPHGRVLVLVPNPGIAGADRARLRDPPRRRRWSDRRGMR
ncbi:DEAD/DEAH box helicase family protein [Nocardia sp. SSK8]|uniref:DEAD/DEAH box helicase family protein n=1 Tax=Nocardia sp. SSK8 TaxID=3120154 RepID=UPI003FA58458